MKFNSGRRRPEFTQKFFGLRNESNCRDLTMEDKQRLLHTVRKRQQDDRFIIYKTTDELEADVNTDTRHSECLYDKYLK